MKFQRVIQNSSFKWHFIQGIRCIFVQLLISFSLFVLAIKVRNLIVKNISFKQFLFQVILLKFVSLLK